MMKNRLISILLSLMMLLSACMLCFTGCAPEEEGEDLTNVNVATTLVMWCVSEQGTDDEQAQEVAKAMSRLTQSEFNTKLLIKYLSMDEYYEQLEAAMTQLAADKAAEEQAKKDRNNKKDKNNTEVAQPTQPEAPKSDELMYDEDGNPIIDTTVYPDVKDYQVDILYLSGYDKYTEYAAKKWLAKLDTELRGNSSEIRSFVPPALLGAVSYNGATYAIPNNNVIGEYTYMLIDKALYDKYFYTASIDSVHNVVDLSSFLEDIVAYEPDVLPIDGDVNYCMNLIAHYWDIDPETFGVTGDFSVLGYVYKDTDTINRGDVALKFDSLLTDKTYRNDLTNLMDFEFKGYFGTAKEGQKSAVSFVKGDATDAKQYEKDHYVVVVDYPRANDEDLYENMFAVSAFTTDVAKSMEIVTWINTNEEFRNLFQYGIENENYTLNMDGTVSSTRNNAYHMDLSKTGNEFIAYVPEGTDLQVWEYAKQQNREATIHPLLSFDFGYELFDQSAEMADEASTEDEYIIERLDTEMLDYIAELSDEVWARIQACENTAQLEELLDQLAVELAPASDEYIRRAMVCDYSSEPKFDREGNIRVDGNGNPLVENPTVDVKCEVKFRMVDDKEEMYYVYTKTFTPYQIYYRWMVDYGYCPAGFPS